MPTTSWKVREKYERLNPAISASSSSAWRCPTCPSRIIKTRLILATFRALDCLEGGMATSYYLAVEGWFKFPPAYTLELLFGEGTVVDPRTGRLLIREKLQAGRLPGPALASSSVSESAGIRLGAPLISWLGNPSTIERVEWDQR